MRTPVVTAVLLAASCALLTATQDDSLQHVRVRTRDLGSMFPGRDTHPNAINNRNQLVGIAFREGDPVAFLWTPEDGFQTIVENGNAADINDRGDVVGTWRECMGQPPGRSCVTKGFIWNEDDGFRDLGRFIPFAVNNERDIAGAVDWRLFDYEAAVMLSDGSLIGPLVGTTSVAFGINRHGESAVTDPWTSFGRALFFSRDGSLTQLRSAAIASAVAINDAGTVTGTRVWENMPFAVKWNGTTRITAPVLSHGSANNREQVVGTLLSSEGQAPMLWDPEWGIVQLSPFADNGLDHAADINDRGVIVGPVRGASGVVHVTLWGVRAPVEIADDEDQ